MVDSTQRDILRNHCLYQKSWVGEPKCSHVSLTLRTPRRTPRGYTGKFVISDAENDIKNIESFQTHNGTAMKYDAKIPTSDSSPDIDQSSPLSHNGKRSQLVKSEEPSSSGHAWALGTSSTSEIQKKRHQRPYSLPNFSQYSDEARSSFEILEDRRHARITRRKPWTESTPRLHGSGVQSSSAVLYYEAFLPDDSDDGSLKRRSRKYVTNSKYGNIYEVKLPKKPKPRPKTPPLGTWFWEDDFQIWKYDKVICSPRVSAWRSDTDRTTTRSRGKRVKDGDKPHADLFAHYHSYRLEKHRQRDAAVLIQKHVRGWLIRAKLKRLKRKALLEHGMIWQKFILEYKQLIVRLQARYGENKAECGISLDEVEAFMDLKYKYERAFDECAYGAKLLKSDLPKFFQKCELDPTDKELSKAFDTVFKGAGNTAEVVFVLDCSSSVGPYAFKYLTTFVKDVIQSFEIGPERVRVGVVPYNDAIYQSFGLTTFSTKQSLMIAIDEIQPRSGITRTDLAIKKMSHMMLVARPGVQRIGVVITDGRSSHPDYTKTAANTAHRDNITMFAIGVGSGVDQEEMKAIASSPNNIFTVTDYTCLKTLKEKLAKSTCLEASGKEGNIQGKCRPLYKEEVMELLWTIYPPAATRIAENRKSTWMHPIVDGVQKDAWSLLDDEDLKATDIKTCLRVVIQAKLERQGFVYLPSKVRYGVEKITDPDEAVKAVNDWMNSSEGKAMLEKSDNSGWS